MPSRLIWETKIEENRVMNGQIQRETAQIFQFPPPGARARLSRTLQANPKAMSGLIQVETVASCGAWYHEAAMSEVDRSRKP